MTPFKEISGEPSSETIFQPPNKTGSTPLLYNSIHSLFAAACALSPSLETVPIQAISLITIFANAEKGIIKTIKKKKGPPLAREAQNTISLLKNIIKQQNPVDNRKRDCQPYRHPYLPSRNSHFNLPPFS